MEAPAPQAHTIMEAERVEMVVVSANQNDGRVTAVAPGRVDGRRSGVFFKSEGAARPFDAVGELCAPPSTAGVKRDAYDLASM